MLTRQLSDREFERMVGELEKANSLAELEAVVKDVIERSNQEREEENEVSTK